MSRLDRVSGTEYEQYYLNMAITEAVREGWWPFRIAGPANVFTEYDIEFMRTSLLIEFPSIEYYVRATIDHDAMLNDPRVATDLVGMAIFKQLRYRESLPVTSNIELGEN